MYAHALQNIANTLKWPDECVQVSKTEVGGSLKANTSLDLTVASDHQQNVILNSKIHTSI